jgi:hypothetical protein
MVSWGYGGLMDLGCAFDVHCGCEGHGGPPGHLPGTS